MPLCACVRARACCSNIEMLLIAAFTWVKCKREEDKNCTHVFLEEANIRGHPGSGFFADHTYVRLGLVTRQHDFDMLISRLEQFISQEEENGTAQVISINIPKILT